jgi:hypothetical protein
MSDENDKPYNPIRHATKAKELNLPKVPLLAWNLSDSDYEIFTYQRDKVAKKTHRTPGVQWKWKDETNYLVLLSGDRPVLAIAIYPDENRPDCAHCGYWHGSYDTSK